MSPQRLNSQKINTHNLETDKTEEETDQKFEEIDEKFPKPLKLMQAYTDGHLGTYSPCSIN